MRGLASSRQAARQGFALSLTMLLSSIDAVSAQAALDLIQAHLQSSKSQKASPYSALLFLHLVFPSTWRAAQTLGLAPCHYCMDDAIYYLKVVCRNLRTLGKKAVCQKGDACFVEFGSSKVYVSNRHLTCTCAFCRVQMPGKLLWAAFLDTLPSYAAAGQVKIPL